MAGIDILQDDTFHFQVHFPDDLGGPRLCRAWNDQQTLREVVAPMAKRLGVNLDECAIFLFYSAVPVDWDDAAGNVQFEELQVIYKDDPPPRGIPGVHVLRRKEAIRLLTKHKGETGCYMIRPSESSSCYVLSVIADGEIKHFRISTSYGPHGVPMFQISNRAFPHLTELITFYKHKPLLCKATGCAIHLNKPLSRRRRRSGHRSSSMADRLRASGRQSRSRTTSQHPKEHQLVQHQHSQERFNATPSARPHQCSSPGREATRSASVHRYDEARYDNIAGQRMLPPPSPDPASMRSYQDELECSLPPHWYVAFSPEHGNRPYFYNSRTRETSFLAPTRPQLDQDQQQEYWMLSHAHTRSGSFVSEATASVTSDMSLHPPSAMSSPFSSRHGSQHTRGGSGRRGPTGANDPSSVRQCCSSTATRSTSSAGGNQTGRIAYVWCALTTEMISEDTGAVFQAVYYYNRITKESVWEKPLDYPGDALIKQGDKYMRIPRAKVQQFMREQRASSLSGSSDGTGACRYPSQYAREQHSSSKHATQMRADGVGANDSVNSLTTRLTWASMRDKEELRVHGAAQTQEMLGAHQVLGDASGRNNHAPQQRLCTASPSSVTSNGSSSSSSSSSSSNSNSSYTGGMGAASSGTAALVNSKDGRASSRLRPSCPQESTPPPIPPRPGPPPCPSRATKPSVRGHSRRGIATPLVATATASSAATSPATQSVEQARAPAHQPSIEPKKDSKEQQQHSRQQQQQQQQQEAESLPTYIPKPMFGQGEQDKTLDAMLPLLPPPPPPAPPTETSSARPPPIAPQGGNPPMANDFEDQLRNAASALKPTSRPSAKESAKSRPLVRTNRCNTLCSALKRAIDQRRCAIGASDSDGSENESSSSDYEWADD